jgi:hypothetical protein
MASGFVNEVQACGGGGFYERESAPREGREGCVNVSLVSIQNLVCVEMKYICVRVAMIFSLFCSHWAREREREGHHMIVFINAWIDYCFLPCMHVFPFIPCGLGITGNMHDYSFLYYLHERLFSSFSAIKNLLAWTFVFLPFVRSIILSQGTGVGGEGYGNAGGRTMVLR